MPTTLKFTDFVQPTDTIPNNDYIVGYNKINGVDIEAKWNLYKLASEALPTSGLATKNHQVRQLATRIYEDTYSLAAITRDEEVICWGRNAQVGLAGVILVDQTYTKFGAGFTALDSAAVGGPVVIPFMRGTVTDPNQDIYNLKSNGLAIEQLYWGKYGAMARLTDGSVWVKAAVGTTRANGLGSATEQPTVATSHYYSSAFYKVNFSSLSNPAATMNARWIYAYPNVSDTGAIYMAIDQFDDLHIWGTCGVTGLTAPYGNIFKGNGNVWSVLSPANVTNGVTNLAQNIRHARVIGGFSAAAKHTLFVITNTDQLWAIGSNATGLLANKTLTNSNVWVRSKMLNESVSPSVEIDVSNAQSFIEASGQEHVMGYISTNDGSVQNRVFITGTNKNADALLAAPLGPIASTIANSLYRANPTVSGMYDTYQKGFVTPQHTLVVMTKFGSVFSCGRNHDGSAGRSGIKQTSLTRVGYRDPSSTTNATVNFGVGTVGALSAIDITSDSSAQDQNITAVLTKNSNNRTQYYLAGAYTFTSAAVSYLKNDSTFRLLPTKESADQIILGGNLNTHVYTIVHTESCRTYGYGYAPYGLMQSTQHLAGTDIPALIKMWNPQQTIIF